MDFKYYNGNVRLISINFDGLREMYDGNLDEYDPSEEQLNKQYVGKIGKFVEGSYFFNDYWRAASVQVEFANGWVQVVYATDVEATDDPVTPIEYLPEVNNTDDGDFRELTTDEKGLLIA